MNTTYQVNKANADAARADYEAILEESRHPFEVSEALLLAILEDNKDTEYGRKYDFAGIHSYEEYRKKVPVIVYEDIAEEIRRMADGEQNILTAYPFNHMNETSGTVGAPKLVPLTDALTRTFLKYNKHYMDAFYADKLGDAWMQGKLFCTAQGKYRTAASGITIGDASSKMAEYVQGGRAGLDTILRQVYTSPVEASIPLPGTDARYIHTRFALAEKNVTGIVTGFYVMVVQYLHYIAEHYELLIEDIEKGTIDSSIEMPPEVREALLAKLQPMPERAAELREIFQNGSDFRFVRSVWPNLQFLYGVGGDGFSVFTRTLRRQYLDEEVRLVYAGINSSEGLWSVPVEPDSEDSMLALGSAFMEFLPVDAGDDFSRCVTADKLEIGKTYEIIATNQSGFYRYRMSDAVKVVSYFNNTPRVRFMYRVNKVINLAAEKTSEKALQQTVERAAQELGFELSDFTVYPDAETVPAQYVFLIQPEKKVENVELSRLEETLERHLREANEEYGAYVDGGRLRPCRAYWLQPQTTFLWRDLQIAKGKSASQLKPLRILSEEHKPFFYILRDE